MFAEMAKTECAGLRAFLGWQFSLPTSYIVEGIRSGRDFENIAAVVLALDAHNPTLKLELQL